MAECFCHEIMAHLQDYVQFPLHVAADASALCAIIVCLQQGGSKRHRHDCCHGFPCWHCDHCTVTLAVFCCHLLHGKTLISSHFPTCDSCFCCISHRVFTSQPLSYWRGDAYAGDAHFPKHSLEYSLNFWSQSKKKNIGEGTHSIWGWVYATMLMEGSTTKA